jgi:hypothetical protein
VLTISYLITSRPYYLLLISTKVKAGISLLLCRK